MPFRLPISLIGSQEKSRISSKEGCLLDFGLRAMSFHTAVAPDCKQGDYVTGEIAILPLSIRHYVPS